VEAAHNPAWESLHLRYGDVASHPS